MRLTDFPEDDLLAEDLLLDLLELLEEDFDDGVPERAWDEELERWWLEEDGMMVGRRGRIEDGEFGEVGLAELKR